ncbi:MAG: triose-phosphate isomerase, partial [Abditibacteriota bacterium]|nr:triose-phosphate isomerase [Abditibacteriota bacterium]
MRKPFIAGNWKMNMLIESGKALVNELKPLVAGYTGVDICVCPTAAALSKVADELKGTNIMAGAQGCFWKESG